MIDASGRILMNDTHDQLVTKLTVPTQSIKGLCYLLVMFCLPYSTEAALLKEAAFFSEIPVLTSATRLKQNPHNSPASVTVLDQHIIKASGAQTLADVLALAPGFQVFHLNTNRQAANYHGVNDQFPNQLEIMVNGRSVYLPLLSTVLWHTLGINIDDIDRVEIIRGSNSATQGSNAFLGAVNFITKSPMSEPQLTSRLSHGSFGTTQANLTHSSQIDGAFYRISASTEKSDGNKTFNDRIERHYINADWVWTPSINDTISLSLGYDRGLSTLGYLYRYGNQFGSFPLNEYYITQQNYHSNFQHIKWNRVLDESNKLHVSAYHNHLNLNERQPTVDEIYKFYLGSEQGLIDLAENILSSNPSFRGYREHGKTSLLDIEMALESKVSNTIDTFTGIGLRKDIASSPVLLQSGKVNSERFRLFNSTEFMVHPFLTLNLGAMHEYQSRDISATSARLALNYQLTPATSVRMGYSHSQRLPSLLERYSNYTVILPQPLQIDRENKKLSHEKNNTIEAGIYHHFSNLNGSIDIRLFNESITDAIALYREDNIGQRRNIGNWTNRGVEAQLKIKPLEELWFLLNYSYLNNQVGNWYQSNDIKSSNNTFLGGQLAPRHTLSLLGNLTLPHDINLSTTYYFIDNVRWKNNYTTLEQPSYQRVDIRVGKAWQLGNNTAEVSAIIRNAFHSDYQTFYKDHRYARSAFLQLNVTMD